MNLRMALDQAEARLRSGPHRERARLDAESLLLHVTGKNKAWLMTRLDEQLAEADASLYFELIERRFRGEPVQYILGESEFYGLPFRVTRAVLAPRPETEHLVEKVLDLAASFQAPRIVDIGTGSGIIAVALACKLPRAEITAIDISASALKLARTNAQRNGVLDRIRFLEGNLLAPVAGEQFEIVVSNPPYIPTTDRASLAVEVRDYEPELALFAGSDGLDIYRRLIPGSSVALVSGGFLALEIGYGQAPAVKASLTEAGFHNVGFTPDLQGILRVASAQWC